MRLVLITGSIILPILMYYFQRNSTLLNRIYNVCSLIALLVFGNISSLTIYKIIQENKVFMTDIHGVFLNPFFLLSGAYIGVYTLYRLLKYTIEDV